MSSAPVVPSPSTTGCPMRADAAFSRRSVTEPPQFDLTLTVAPGSGT